MGIKNLIGLAVKGFGKALKGDAKKISKVLIGGKGVTKRATNTARGLIVGGAFLTDTAAKKRFKKKKKD
tara:strand:+ start:289 stop:495 length:207 start_codon:yes stop_codon:yes gene_type:complete